MTDSTSPEHAAAPPDTAAQPLQAYRVRFQHDNPAYTHPVTKQLIDPEGLIQDEDYILAASPDDAEEQCSQLHWNDADFTILGVDAITLAEVPSA